MSLTPSFAPNNTTYRRWRYVIFFCESIDGYLSRNVPSFYLINLILSKFSIASRSPFLKHIKTIFGKSAKKQMVRIYAQAIITSVKNAKSICDWAISKLPGNAMSAKLIIFAASLSEMYLSVSITGYRCFPYPASVCFFNFIPKAIFNGYSLWCHNFSSIVTT